MKSKLTLILILFSSLIYFCFSCSTQPDDSTQFSSSAGRGAVYNGLYYSFTNNTISYIDCEIDISPISLCADTLCTHNDTSCPAYFPDYGKRLMVIDPNASNRNAEFPIFYISCCFGDDNKIVRFNAKTNQSTVLVSSIPNVIQSLWIYDDLLYYTSFETDGQLNIQAYDMSANTTYKLDNTNKLRYYIGGIDDLHIYFTDYDGNVYRAPHDLSSTEYICSSVTCGKVYISDNDIFFLSNIHVGSVVEDTNFLACDLLFIPKNDITASPEIVLENISYISVPIIFKYHNTFFYCVCDNVSAQRTIEKFDSRESTTSTIQMFDDGTSSIYIYDLVSKQTTPMIEDSDYNLGMFFAANDQFFVYSGFPYALDKTTEHGIDTSIIIFDYNAKKQYTYDN